MTKFSYNLCPNLEEQASILHISTVIEVHVLLYMYLFTYTSALSIGFAFYIPCILCHIYDVYTCTGDNGDYILSNMFHIFLVEDSNLNMSKGKTDTSTEKCANTTVVDISKETDGCKSDDSCSGIGELCTEISELCTEIEIKTVLSDREEGPSFGQVVEMISKGLPLPGVTDLGIIPLDIEPTTTRMERKAKPWEQG